MFSESYDYKKGVSGTKESADISLCLHIRGPTEKIPFTHFSGVKWQMVLSAYGPY